MPIITALAPLSGAKGRLRVFLDEEYTLTVLKKTAERMELQPGKSIDLRNFVEEIGEEEKNGALNAALHYLCRGERSRFQVARYLQAREYAPDIIDSVLEKIGGYGYVDDGRFARTLLNDRAKAKGKSRRAIRCEMREKGLDPETIEDAMAHYDDKDERSNAMRIAKRYYMKDRDDRAAFERKAGAALARRGYDWDTVREVLQALRDPDGEEEA